MKSIAIMNNKGGVGKTVTAINLADILVRDYGQRVILVDCDGQMNATKFFLPEFDPEINYSVETMLNGDGEPLWSDNLMPIRPRFDLIPGSPALYTLDLEAIRDGANNVDRVREFVEAVREDGGADAIIFDCPPGFTVASTAALMAADDVVIPVTMDGFSIRGMDDMVLQIENLRRANIGVKIAGLLVTQYTRSRVATAAEKLLRELGIPVFETHIRRTVKVPESTFASCALTEYAPECAATEDYRAWVREYLGEVI